MTSINYTVTDSDRPHAIFPSTPKMISTFRRFSVGGDTQCSAAAIWSKTATISRSPLSHEIVADCLDGSNDEGERCEERYVGDVNLPDAHEPLLLESMRRYILFPIRYHEIWELYKQAEACFWVAEDIDLSNDLTDWNDRLNGDECHFVSHVLAFFAASGPAADRNLAERFSQEVQVAEARCFYGFQLMMKNVHSESYSIIIDTYIKDPGHLEHIFKPVETDPFAEDRAKWEFRWISNRNSSFGERLVASAVMHGIFFSGSFAAISWIKARGLLPGLAYAGDHISRDQEMHASFACLLVRILKKHPHPNLVNRIVSEAVAIEQAFLSDALPTDLIGLSSSLMCRYIEYVTDGLLVALGSERLYEVTNPFGFTEESSLEGKTRFDKLLSNCSSANIRAKAERDGFAPTTNEIFTIDEEF